MTKQPLTPDQRNSFLAAVLGWAMDAFDYFIVVFVYADIAKTFGHTKTEVAFLTTATLVMRPLGALLFGLWADRVGRRIPLMVNVIFYSTVGFLCAFAPTFTVLVILRLLYGIGMGGEWAPRTLLIYACLWGSAFVSGFRVGARCALKGYGRAAFWMPETRIGSRVWWVWGRSRRRRALSGLSQCPSSVFDAQPQDREAS